MPLGIWVRGLHGFLILALEAFPLLLRCFALHLCQSLWHIAERVQTLLGDQGKRATNPAPETPS